MSESPTLKEHLERAQHGWPPRYPLVQFPNAPLALAWGGGLAALLTDGAAEAYGSAVFYTGTAAWAWKELTEGANTTRRVLGVAGLALVVARVGAALDS